MPLKTQALIKSYYLPKCKSSHRGVDGSASWPVHFLVKFLVSWKKNSIEYRKFIYINKKTLNNFNAIQ